MRKKPQRLFSRAELLVGAGLIVLGGLFVVAEFSKVALIPRSTYAQIDSRSGRGRVSSTPSLLPSSDIPSNYIPWRTSDGGQQYFSLVDDQGRCDGTTTVAYTTSSPYNDRSLGYRQAQMTLGFPSLDMIPNGRTISKVRVNLCVGAYSATNGSSTLKVILQGPGWDEKQVRFRGQGRVTPLRNETVSLQPRDGAFIKTATTTLQLGFVLESGNKGVQVSRAAAVIEYSR